jgi:RimJ/RimL family protein N-acetyltransferase
MEINTRRLKLRAIAQQDFQAIHEYASDPETVKYMPFGPNTEEETQEFINARAIQIIKEFSHRRQTLSLKDMLRARESVGYLSA